MDNTLAQTGTPLAAPPSALAAMPARAKLMLGIGMAGLIAVIAALALWSNKGDYKVPTPT